MRRWLIAFGLVILSCIPLVLQRATGPELLRDSDTAVLLQHIRERQAPLSWFAGDWPLQNHFYRPVSTLSFELDNALYGDQAAGYGLSQALISFACVLALFWFVRELTDQPLTASAAAILFSFWHWQIGAWMQTVLGALGLLCLAAMLLPKRKPLPAVRAFLVCWTAAVIVLPMGNIESRVVGWLPGRTASVMAVFALIALAAYVRFERLTAQRTAAPDPTPLDPPATKGTTQSMASQKHPWTWIVVSGVALLLSLGSYEQAVMLPASFTIVAVALRYKRYRVHWGWQAVVWGALMGYLALRHALVPSDVSGYQAQQFRTGQGVWISIAEYILPSATAVYAGVKAISPDVLSTTDFLGMFMIFPFSACLALISNVTTYWEARKDWLMPLTALLLAFFTYLPMAWLKYFDHYHYWPMAFRALLAVCLIGLAGKEFANAISLPRLQAPQRLDPAPGSLLRP